MRCISTSQFGRSIFIILSFMILLFSGCGGSGSAPSVSSSYSISGKVYSVGLGGKTGWPDVTVSLGGDRTATTTTDADGNYSFSAPDGHYSVTPSYHGTTFNLPSNEVDVAGAQKTAINFEVVPLPATNVTSTAPKTFKDTRLSYTTNPAYQTLINYVDESKSITIPGLTKTVVGTTATTTFVPQGMCFANKYVLISAYDSEKQKNSVIYVVSKQDKTFKTVLSLPSQDHLGGLAFDGENVWVCIGSSMGVIKYSDIEAYVQTGQPSVIVPAFTQTVQVKTTASFASFYNDRLFIGKFNETATDQMFAYDIINRSSAAPTLNVAIQMEVPIKAQGVAFREDGMMIVSTSYGRNNDGELRFYKPNWDDIDSATVALVHKNDAVATLTVPPMSEGILIDGEFTYVLFESGAAEYADGDSYCKYPLNRVLPFWTYGVVK